MVVVQIHVLVFPIDKKRVSQDCHPSIWYIQRIPLKWDFSGKCDSEEPSWTWVSEMIMCPLKKKVN